MSAEVTRDAEGYVPIGEYVPVVDENGNRPRKTPDGEFRPTEFVPHDGLRHILLRIDPACPVKTRRLVEGTMDALITQANVYATVSAQSWENAAQVIAGKCIKGIKQVSDGATITEEAKLRDFFENGIEWEDILPILATIKHELTLQRAKKKSSSSWFA